MKVYLLLAAIAMALTILLTPAVRWACLRFGIVPALRGRDLQKTPIPRLGGIAMTISLIVTMLVASRIPYMAPLFAGTIPWAVMAGAGGMCILGIIDDIIELDWMAKLGGQVLIAGGMAFGGVQLASFPIFGITLGSSRLSLFISVLFIVGIMNAVNFIDGLDGLASGMIAIGAGSFFMCSDIVTRLMGAVAYATTASLIVIALLGVCAGFLWFNFHPSSIMMGGGAETMGLVLGAAGIIVTGKIDPSLLERQQMIVSALPLILPLAVIFMPVADLVVTSVRRMRRGKSPFVADRSHFHDRLLVAGHSHRGVVAILWMWTAIVCIPSVGLLIFDWWKVALGAIIAAAVGVAITTREFPKEENGAQAS